MRPFGDCGAQRRVGRTQSVLQFANECGHAMFVTLVATAGTQTHATSLPHADKLLAGSRDVLCHGARP